MLSRRTSCSADRGINFRDDLSEYSSPSSWGERPGPLSLADHRLTREGLQVRRTVGEALLQAQRERDWEHSTENCAKDCRCVGTRAARFCLSPMRRSAYHSPSRLFTWGEVQSIILLPHDEEGPCPHLIAVSSFRLRDGASREWLLQAASARGRARCAMEMITLTLHERMKPENAHDGGACGCCGPGRANGLSLALYMDMVRVACEMAQLEPSPEAMRLLVEVLGKLAEIHRTPAQSQEMAPSLTGPHFPVAALRRFGDTVRRAQRDFEEFRQYRNVVLLLRTPPNIDDVLWEKRILPFLAPIEPSLRDLGKVAYPEAVGTMLSSAVERCRRTLS